MAKPVKGVNPFAKKGSADTTPVKGTGKPVPPGKGAGKSGKCK